MTQGGVRGCQARSVVLTDKGRRALALDWLGLPLPGNYPAWGAPGSDRCVNGHPVAPGKACRGCYRLRNRLTR